MAAENKKLKEALGEIAAQYFNDTADDWEFLKGFAGAAFYMLRGSMVLDYFSGSSNVTKSYSEPIHGFGIVNDGTANVTVNFGGMNIVVKPGETFDEHFKVGHTGLSVTATSTYRMVVRV